MGPTIFLSGACIPLAAMPAYPMIFAPAMGGLSGYSSTVRRMSPLGKDTGYKPGETVRFNLPDNALCNLRTLKLHFTGKTTSDDDSMGVVLFPSLISGLISRMVVRINGTTIDATPDNYGALLKAVDDFTAGVEQRRARALEQNEFVSGLSQATNDFWAHSVRYGANDENVKTRPTLKKGQRESNRTFVIDHFGPSLLSTLEPEVISTSLLGVVSIEITWAPASALISCKLVGDAQEGLPDKFDGPVPDVYWANLGTDSADFGSADAYPANPSYVIDNVYMTVKTMDISDGRFYNWLADMVKEAPLELPFVSFSMQPGALSAPGDATSSTRMTVDGASVDYIFGTLVPEDSDSGAIQPWEGNATVGGDSNVIYVDPKARYAASNKQYGTYGNSGTSRYFQRGSIDSQQPFSSTFYVNNVRVSEAQSLGDVWATIKDEHSLGQSTKTSLNPRLDNLQQFGRAFFIAPHRLNLKCAEGDFFCPRYRSGVDTRGSTLQILWDLKAKTEHNLRVTPQVWAAKTEVLRVGAGRVVEKM